MATAQGTRRSSGRPAAERRDSLEGRRRNRVAREMMADAGRGLGQAMRAGTPTERYAAAHLAALRVAAAVLATRGPSRRSTGGSVWELLPRAAPELAEWAALFAAGSTKRRAAEAGLSTMVSARDADEMVRQAAAFLDLVEGAMCAA